MKEKEDSLDHRNSQTRTTSRSQLESIRQIVMDTHSSDSHDAAHAKSARERRHAPRHRVAHDAAEGRQAGQLCVSFPLC